MERSRDSDRASDHGGLVGIGQGPQSFPSESSLEPQSEITHPGSSTYKVELTAEIEKLNLSQPNPVSDFSRSSGLTRQPEKTKITEVDADASQDCHELPLTEELPESLAESIELNFAIKAMQRANHVYDLNPESPQSIRAKNSADERFAQVLAKLIPSSESALENAAKIIRSPEATQQEKDQVGRILLLIGVAILAGVGAGAIGAIAVKELIWKEVLKAAIGALITTTSTLLAEQALRKEKS
jgi:hypothetical protein